MRFRDALGLVLALVALVSSIAASAGGRATDFTLRDINGVEVHLSQYEGKVVLMSFWATWCGPCKVEMPHLQQMYTELAAQGLVVLSISSDDARTSGQVKPFISRSGYTFPVLLDKESAVVGTYNPTKTLPYTVLLDRQLNIAHEHSGYNPGDETALRAEVVELLAAAP
jgi:peroxiredoxin